MKGSIMIGMPAAADWPTARAALSRVEAVAASTQPIPSFADGLQVQRVLGAIEASSGAGSAWTNV